LENSQEIDSITSNQRYIIDYANIKSGIITNQKSFQNLEQFNNIIKDPSLGLPMLLPLNNNCFNYENCKEIFSIEPSIISKNIFDTNNLNYIGVKNFLKYGNTFCVGAEPKKKYQRLVSIIQNYNNSLIEKINKIKEGGKTIGAFQTRNIPHLGHEKIIESLLEKCDHVIINPVLGPKKEGDLRNEILKLSFDFLSKNFYQNKISYMPICANMFYAGPREALHHALLRKAVGFSHFIVGRDHAGAENIYDPHAALMLLEDYKNDIGINVITHMGSYFSQKKNKIIIKQEDDLDADLENIRGSDFREHIQNKTYFNYARYELQEYLYTLGDKYFNNY
tara:strand:+ start:3115 stop:4122 length:1008 start_codon:yes stop_codon:yes gene_type:complete